LTCNDTANNYTGIMTYTCSSDRTFFIDKSCKISSPNCTGNTPDTTTVVGQVIHKFLASGSLNCSAAKTVQIMVVGGGGARGVTSSGVGGTGNGTGNASNTTASNATANTGSGGGAAQNTLSGTGGSGIVVIRYPAGTFSCPAGFVISGSDCVPQ
jgi:hypothetical protein